MARPRSDDRHSAIMAAAIRVIATQGLSGSTALIAKEAGVSNGSLFTYFAAKADLLNKLYVALKTEAGAAAFDGLPTKSSTREQMLHVWSRWLHWGTSHPDKRRTLAQLGVSDEITADSHQAGSLAFAGIAKLLTRNMAETAAARSPAQAPVSSAAGRPLSVETNKKQDQREDRRACHPACASRRLFHSRRVGRCRWQLERSRAKGPMRDAPIGLVAALMTGVAEATIDFMMRDPVKEDAHCAASFEAMWRMIA